MSMLTYQEQVTIPAEYCDMFLLTEITELSFEVSSVDGSLFTAVLLPGHQDSCPGFFSGNMISDCDQVLECSGHLSQLNGNYSFFVVNDNILEDGYFNIEFSDDGDYIVYIVTYIIIFSCFCSCGISCCICMGVFICRSRRSNIVNVTNIELGQLPDRSQYPTNKALL